MPCLNLFKGALHNSRGRYSDPSRFPSGRSCLPKSNGLSLRNAECPSVLDLLCDIRCLGATIYVRVDRN
jgi:hypothetical protein